MNAPHKPLPPQEKLLAEFSYDRDSGVVFSRTCRPNVKRGAPVGNLKYGYLRVCFEYQLYQLHRIIWRMVTGEDPGEHEVDHVNGNRSDNRWTNLRLCVRKNNQRNKCIQKNNTSGVKGVSLDTRSGLWRATLKVNGKQVLSRYFRDVADAIEAVTEARKEHHKEFANHG